MEDELISIDENKLDVELVKQPKMVLKYGEEEADARHRFAQAKAALELAESELILDIRSNPKKYLILEKPTESIVRAVIVKTQRYRNAIEALNDRKHDLDILSAAVSALEHRKKSLEGLVSLHGQNYFAAPKEPKNYDLREARDEVARRETLPSRPLNKPPKGKQRDTD